MTIYSEGQRPSTLEEKFGPHWSDELLQYKDRQLVIHIAGKPGAKFDFEDHKYNPTDIDGQGIVSTVSGNDYFIFTRHRSATGIMNTRESIEQGKLVIKYLKDAQLPVVEFGKPWIIPNFYKTSAVKDIYLAYKVASPDHTVGREIDEQNPFDKYARLINSKMQANS